jgi:uncharacterized membrane protein
MHMKYFPSMRAMLFVTILGLATLACSKSDDNDNSTPPGNTCSGTPGPLFTAVKGIIDAQCVSCHQSGGQASFAPFTNNCNIVAQSANIRTRAVVQGTMPPSGPLSQADKDKINAWVAAGGKLEN